MKSRINLFIVAALMSLTFLAGAVLWMVHIEYQERMEESV